MLNFVRTHFKNNTVIARRPKADEAIFTTCSSAPACYKLKLVDGGLPSHHTENPFSGADFDAAKICLLAEDISAIYFLGLPKA